MHITVTKDESPLNSKNRYFAIDLDTYDGAPDGNNVIGWGGCKLEAVVDLCEKLEDEGIYDGC